jgi:hypothetical protein
VQGDSELPEAKFLTGAIFCAIVRPIRDRKALAARHDRTLAVCCERPSKGRASARFRSLATAESERGFPAPLRVRRGLSVTTGGGRQRRDHSQNRRASFAMIAGGHPANLRNVRCYLEKGRSWPPIRLARVCRVPGGYGSPQLLTASKPRPNRFLCMAIRSAEERKCFLIQLGRNLSEVYCRCARRRLPA